jgi:hypothetical protein
VFIPRDGSVTHRVFIDAVHKFERRASAHDLTALLSTSLPEYTEFFCADEPWTRNPLA